MILWVNKLNNTSKTVNTMFDTQEMNNLLDFSFALYAIETEHAVGISWWERLRTIKPKFIDSNCITVM